MIALMAVGLPVRELLAQRDLVGGVGNLHAEGRARVDDGVDESSEVARSTDIDSTVIVHDQTVDDVGSGPCNGAHQIHAVARAP